MAERVMWGVVGKKATIISGTGFRVVHADKGLYTVVFDEQFNALPAVVASQLFPNEVDSHGGDTRDNAVIVGIENDRFRVKVGDADGDAGERDFTFVAVGH